MRDSQSQDVIEDSEPISSDQADDVVVRGGVAEEFWSVTHEIRTLTVSQQIFRMTMPHAFLDALERDLKHWQRPVGNRVHRRLADGRSC